MKITIEFDDQEEARDALDGYKWKLVVWDLDQELRQRTKYTSEQDNVDVIEALYKLREEIREMLSNYNLQLD